MLPAAPVAARRDATTYSASAAWRCPHEGDAECSSIVSAAEQRLPELQPRNADRYLHVVACRHNAIVPEDLARRPRPRVPRRARDIEQRRDRTPTATVHQREHRADLLRGGGHPAMPQAQIA